MHRKMINDATEEQLKSFLYDFIDELKERSEELYEEAELDLYKSIYGCHFTDWKLKCATEKMINEDGTKGSHFSLEQTNNIIRSNNIVLEKFNQYDFNYAMNMIYSDFYGTILNDTSSYLKMALKFLNDKDAPDGKAFRYYIAMHEE